MNDTIEINEAELYEVYSLLSDATDAAANGDPNTCASKASNAKAKVLEIHSKASK